jgi:hypothetical protein
MNGGTSLRAEGVIKRRAASNIGSLLSMTRAARPAVAAFFRMICGVRSRNQTLIVTALTALRRTTRLRGKRCETQQT